MFRGNKPKCGCSSSGRAPPCQGGGSEFEPRHPLHEKARTQSVRAFFREIRPVDFAVRMPQMPDGIKGHDSSVNPLEPGAASIGAIPGKQRMPTLLYKKGPSGFTGGAFCFVDGKLTAASLFSPVFRKTAPTPFPEDAPRSGGTPKTPPPAQPRPAAPGRAPSHTGPAASSGHRAD